MVDYKFGVTRRVELNNELDYVIKTPYAWNEYGDLTFDSEEEEGCFFNEGMEEDEIDGDGKWYNQREIEVYNLVKDKYDCFAAVDELSTPKALLMERVECTVGDYSDDYNNTIRNFTERQFNELDTNAISINSLMSAVLRYNEASDTKITLREIKHFLGQLRQLEESDNDKLTDVLSDLHTNNIGFKEGHIKIIDYAGCTF